jgi:hypothetical protein
MLLFWADACSPNPLYRFQSEIFCPDRANSSLTKPVQLLHRS